MRHAWVLIIAIILPTLAPHKMISLTPNSLLAQLDGSSIQLSATIKNKPSIPFLSQRAQSTLVAPGQTLASIASTFHTDMSALRWANNIVDLQEPTAGTTLLIPPGTGALEPTYPAETPTQFANRVGVDPRTLLDYNQLSHDSVRPYGTFLQIPKEVAPSKALLADQVVPVTPGVPGVPSTQLINGVGESQFPYGQCTFYVSTKRRVNWSGNADQWLGNAQKVGRATGKIPVVGAIVVMTGSWVGHVAFVQSLNPDGSFVVSEMNVEGVGVVDQRTITAGSPNVLGFIY